MKKFWKHKSKFAAFALVLLMASVLLTLYTPVQAQYTNMQEGGSIPLPPGVTPDVTLDTISHLSFTPNPIGVGQGVLVNLWLQPPCHVTRYFKEAFSVTFTDPDGNEDVVGPISSYQGDTSAWLIYTVDQTGTWTVKLDFNGGYFPPGNYTSVGTIFTGEAVFSFEESCYYKPSSDGPYDLTVQEEQVLSWPASELPTDYWTRPISPEHREWWVIGGNCPFTGRGGGPDWPADTNVYMSNYKFTPWVQGPNTAHIVWRDQGSALSGITGMAGQWAAPINYDEAYTTARGAYGAGPGSAGNPNILFQGRLYGKVLSVFNGEPMYVWRCTDVRTGEVIWEQPWTSQMPTMITSELYAGAGAGYVEGAGERADRLLVSLIYLGGGRLIKYSPTNGGVLSNISIPVTSGSVYADPYVLSVQNLGGGNRRLINWTIEGNTDNFTQRVMNNITWPWNNIGNVQDFEAGIAVATSTISSPATGVAIDARISAASLTTGAELWDIPAGVGFAMFSGSTRCADHGKFAARFNDGYYHCWDLYSGTKLWKSESTNWPWDTFSAYYVSSAYGFLYDNTYVGIRAIDWDTGKVAWVFEAPTPYAYETPYEGQYPFFSGNLIADGKIYAYNLEHSPSAPFTRGLRLLCFNATTGEGIWNVTGCMVPGLVADGYLTACNWYDGYMYVFGKGKSATTVEAPLTAIPLGESVMLTGTVLDQSPAQLGTPCVSRESMTEWMEYLHMQKPIPAEVTGVPVSLDTLDPNGNYIHIGDVTTDMSGTFGLMWTPEVPGEYKVMATFMGDDSYGSSWAETHVGVVEAPEPPPEYGTPEWPAYPEPEKPADYTPMFLGLTAAIVVVALLVVYDIFFRKRK